MSSVKRKMPPWIDFKLVDRVHSQSCELTHTFKLRIEI